MMAGCATYLPPSKRYVGLGSPSVSPVAWEEKGTEICDALDMSNMDQAWRVHMQAVHEELAAQCVEAPQQPVFDFRPLASKPTSRLTDLGEESVAFAQVARLARRLRDWEVTRSPTLRAKIVRGIPNAVRVLQVPFAQTDD
eukprot:3077362-Amphidinium_carterae.1